MPSPRRTRSHIKEAAPSDAVPLRTADANLLTGGITPLRAILTTSNTGLSTRNLSLLRAKRAKLRDRNGQIPAFIRSCCAAADSDTATHALAEAARATLVFAQTEAGTAVCISPEGLLLTCAHCVAESEEEWMSMKKRKRLWCLLFSDGCVVQAKCTAWDGRRDLALLRVVAAQHAASTADTTPPSFPALSIGETTPRLRSPLLCIGHPGSEDLETAESGVATDYAALHISLGHFRGLELGQDPQDNSTIGALKHDCWTYWGHSGAPLIERKTGKLVGLHSSWDEETGMRRGLALDAINPFLEEHGALWARQVRVVRAYSDR